MDIATGHFPYHHARVWSCHEVNKCCLAIVRLIFCFCLVPVSSTTFGQAIFGGILGTLTDPSGVPVSGAVVRVTDQSRGTSEQTTTNESGNYSVTHLTPGVYTVRVEGEGFKTLKFKDIAVSAETSLRVDGQSRIRSASEQVEETDEAAQLKTDHADVSI